jgi:hypothetical protein
MNCLPSRLYCLSVIDLQFLITPLIFLIMYRLMFFFLLFREIVDHHRITFHCIPVFLFFLFNVELDLHELVHSIVVHIDITHVVY